MNTEALTDLLASHQTLGKAPRTELQWIACHGTLRAFQQGEVVSQESEMVDGMYIVLSGSVSFYMQRGSGMRKMTVTRGGDVTGLLPFSRMTTPPGKAIVEEPTQAILIPRDKMPELIRNCYEVSSILVHQMIDRARQFTSTDLREEKMISLGKLAAGFAHEVNNPASAAHRDATSLLRTMSAVEETTRSLYATGLTREELAALEELWMICKAAPRKLSGLALADREDEISAWLSGRSIDTQIAQDLARAPVTNADLDAFAAAVPGSKVNAALGWVAAHSSARSLVVGIERAAKRILDLVSAAKGFTHMDRAPDIESVDLQAGLSDTVALQEGKARRRHVAISLSIPGELPPILGLGVELNQVWMNLIDNAIDAAPEHGHVGVTASHEGADVIVSVIDDGPGIPPEIREKLFEPFFTTKPVGQGTGLGLDIVRRVILWHNGEISLDSGQGRTEFRVRLPIGGRG